MLLYIPFFCMCVLFTFLIPSISSFRAVPPEGRKRREKKLRPPSCFRAPTNEHRRNPLVGWKTRKKSNKKKKEGRRSKPRKTRLASVFRGRALQWTGIFPIPLFFFLTFSFFKFCISPFDNLSEEDEEFFFLQFLSDAAAGRSAPIASHEPLVAG